MPELAQNLASVDLGELLRGVAPRVVEWRRHLHANPELSFEEHATAAFVADVLAELGLDPLHPTPTSVVADVEGGAPGTTIAVRADLDALPVDEETDLAFASRNRGVMHACGHDGHTAVLLGLATVLVQARRQIAGRVRLIFQHAEERAPGGAEELIAAGVLDGVDLILGAHLWAPLPLGVVGLTKGPTMASTDYFEVSFRGAGGHAGSPHEAADPIAASVDLVRGTERLVARRIDPLAPAVVSVTRLRAGEAPNVIPGEAQVGGTLRALTPAVRQELLRRFEELADQVAAAHALDLSLDFRQGPPPLVNDPRIVDVYARAGRACDGTLSIREQSPLLAGEDFARYLEQIPGAYAFIGAGEADGGGPFPHHHPHFVIDERALAIATELLGRTVFELSQSNPTDQEKR